MRIFYFHFGLLPDPPADSVGGANRHLIETVNKLSGRGHEVVFFTGGQPRELDYLEADEIIFYGVSGFSDFLGNFLLLLINSTYLMIKKIITDDKPDLIYTREMPYTAHTSLVSQIFSLPHYVEINGFLPECVPMESGYKPWHYPVLIFFEAINYWQATAIVSVSQSAKERICSFYNLNEDKVEWVRNGTDADRLKPMDADECKENLGMDTEKQYVGFVGSFFQYTGLEYLVEAASDVVEETDGVEFVLVGNGDIEEKLLDMIHGRNLSDYFHFPGYVSWEKVPIYINSFDVCVNPRRDSGQSGDPLKTYEYMSCGKPVVASDVGELRDLVEGNSAGYCFHPGDTGDFADKLIKILANRDLCEKMGRNAREAIVTRYTWEHTVDGIEDVMNRLLRG